MIINTYLTIAYDHPFSICNGMKVNCRVKQGDKVKAIAIHPESEDNMVVVFLFGGEQYSTSATNFEEFYAD